MKHVSNSYRNCTGTGIFLLAWLGHVVCSHANPTGGTVTQGAANFNTSGSQFTINQTSPNAFINWQTFNIAGGETTTFNQPSTSSVTWNQINDANPSQILGTLNANGYVILQNPSGFFVGGQASITAHGLVMTTASTPALDLSSSGPWSFNAPPPTARIINYGQISIAGGGSAFLIANDIQNNGTISAPGGHIGLYAGQTVLVSTAPDGRGLSAQVTLPRGSVDNEGNLIADGGEIVAQAQLVNQNGLVQANSAQNVNGVIELVAGGSQSTMSLGANSVISAQGDTQSASPGGLITIKSDDRFSDQAGSTINIAGGSQGGNGGQVEISAPQMNAINSSINGQAADGFINGVLSIDPLNIVLASSSSDPNAQYSGTVNPGDPPANGTLTLNVNSFASTLSQINLQASQNITLNTTWTLAPQTIPSTLSLSAGNDITLNGSLIAGNNWNVNLMAGTAFISTPGQTKPLSGSYGIYVNSSLQTLNGNIVLDAANEVIVGGGGAIRTIGGGNIDVTAQYGNVNSGGNGNGFSYFALGNGTAAKPYYTPFQLVGSGTQQHVDFTQSKLGGISTAAGGNVTINAGGDVTSFGAGIVAAGDPGTGAFGPEPGNVTINAGGSVYGNYVLMNGAGIIHAGENIGLETYDSATGNTVYNDVALSLAKGSWTLNAQDNIYLQEVRNPNGVFNNTTVGLTGNPSAGNHLFDYDLQASVSLTAGNGVFLTGQNLPRPNGAVPMLLPPTLILNAGPGGVVLDTPTALADNQNDYITLSEFDITLFPSPYGNLEITTTGGGGLSGGNSDGTATSLLMSDSAQTRWSGNPTSSGAQPFSETDHASLPAELNNASPVVFNISGNMENIILQVSKFAHLNVGGDMIGCAFYGENFQPDQVTSINVGGQIYNGISFTSIKLDQAFPGLPANDLPPGYVNSLFQVLLLAVDPAKLATLSGTVITSPNLQDWLAYLNTHGAFLFGNLNLSGVSYNPATQVLTVAGPMSGDILKALTEPNLTFLEFGPNGLPLLDSSGHFVTDPNPLPWTSAIGANYAEINKLFTESQGVLPLAVANRAYVVGGTGFFDVTANSIALGNSGGILSAGSGGVGRDYSFLAPYITSGATINVTVLGQQQVVDNVTGEIGPSLYMPASTIAALGGGDVNVTAPNSSMDLGSSDLADFESEIMDASGFGLGIYTTGGGNVNVTALGDINVDTSRIGTFNGGDVFVESYTGNVNAGSGGSTFTVPIHVFSSDGSSFGEKVYANGIVAETLIDPSKIPGGATVPGDITVWTPQGNIIANQGGIKQEALNGSAPTGPVVTLTAGTPAVPGDFLNLSGPPIFLGNIQLGTVGVIGETVIAQATGTITGLAVSRHNTSITSQTVGSLTVLAGGTANVSAQSSGSGNGITIIGGTGVNASGIGAGATLLGQNVSVNGGAATSTMGTSASATAASQSAAGQAGSQTQSQIASNDNGNDDEKKKKKTGLARSVGRVTVILPRPS